ncbi:[acyl-carrier-protein] S-malonyltransferase [Melghiribacillus thermohalophilus]|uniref:Malonyl CoA-acyl carrier protein transacylase n=1 Tax=Melghiribacillus thermohalophilus TaxID=1324956 RepID=A0A4R3NB33_9BACI|nr:ACP S-malonyltransferase [Melghiribacillus thermohalophilus]TCT26807.1 [acyl-carrier-protein] S-malonyltransferase [Melghiribacillus thermohalophilus]
MKRVAFVYPGQGSQDVGMGKAFYDNNQDVRKFVDEAEDILRVPIKTFMFEGPQDQLTKTEHAQPALLLTSAAITRVLQHEGVKPTMAAGHSLGEYSALVCAGALEPAVALRLVQTRGQLMEEAYPSGKGAMAAVLGLDDGTIEKVAAEVSEKGETVDVANFNCPGQIVISGTKAGVEEASRRLKESGAKRVIPLNVSGPFHSRLMEPASEKFAVHLREAVINRAEIPVYANVTAQPVETPDEIYDLLVKQIYSPVRFSESIEHMMDEVDAFVEVGNGKVLSGLIRKMNRRKKTFAVQDPESLQEFLEWYKG